MDFRAVSTLLLVFGLFIVIAAGGGAYGSQLGQVDTTAGDADDRPDRESSGEGVVTADSGSPSESVVDAASGEPDLQLASIEHPSTIAPDEDLTVNYTVENVGEFSSGELIDTGSDWDSPPVYWPDEYVVPTIAAPGVNTLSSVPGGGYDDAFIGTSMAAPHVSGAIALGLSASEANVTPELVGQALEFTAFKPVDAPVPPGERDTRYGSGIIDADALVEYLMDPPTGETVTYTVSMADTGDSHGSEVFVGNGSSTPPGGAEFEVVNAEIDQSLVEGEILEIPVEVANVGTESGSKSVEAHADGLGSETVTLELGAGNSTEETFELDTDIGDAGEYTVSVETPDHGWAFDFDEDGTVDIFDVQTLFEQL